MYERTGRNKVIYTYALSALWHGFYPGYYLTFASGAFFTVAARSVSILELMLYFKNCERIRLLIINFPYSCRMAIGPSLYSAAVSGISTKEDFLRCFNVHHDENCNGLHNVQLCIIRIYTKHQSVPVSHLLLIRMIVGMMFFDMETSNLFIEGYIFNYKKSDFD